VLILRNQNDATIIPRLSFGNVGSFQAVDQKKPWILQDNQKIMSGSFQRNPPRNIFWKKYPGG
jgi:hypothetical protein